MPHGSTIAGNGENDAGMSAASSTIPNDDVTRHSLGVWNTNPVTREATGRHIDVTSGCHVNHT